MTSQQLLSNVPTFTAYNVDCRSGGAGGETDPPLVERFAGVPTEAFGPKAASLHKQATGRRKRLLLERVAVLRDHLGCKLKMIAGDRCSIQKFCEVKPKTLKKLAEESLQFRIAIPPRAKS